VKKITTAVIVAIALSIGAFGAQNKNAKAPAKSSTQNTNAKPAKAKPAAAPADDASIAAAVKAKLAKTPSLKNATLDASSKDGVVTLTGGPLKTGGLKGVATNVAKSVKGVKKVDNQITVEAKAAPAKKAPAANKAPAAKSTKPKGNKNG
jgi:osmotically-inducible protein OsmY